MKKFGLFTIFALCGVMALPILACGTASAVKTSNEASQPSNAATRPTTAEVGGVGDAWTQDGLQATLASVKTWTPGEYAPTPSAGDEFIVIHLKLHNVGDRTVDFNAYEYKLLTGGGATKEQSITTYDANKLLQSGTLATGGIVEGDLIFEVAKDDHGAALVWQRGLDTSLDTKWLLGL